MPGEYIQPLSSARPTLRDPLYTYTCNQSTGNCGRQTVADGAGNTTTGSGTLFAYHANALHLCALMCGRYRTLWPQPSGPSRLGNRFVAIDLATVR